MRIQIYKASSTPLIKVYQAHASQPNVHDIVTGVHKSSTYFAGGGFSLDNTLILEE